MQNSPRDDWRGREGVLIEKGRVYTMTDRMDIWISWNRRQVSNLVCLYIYIMDLFWDNGLKYYFLKIKNLDVLHLLIVGCLRVWSDIYCTIDLFVHLLIQNTCSNTLSTIMWLCFLFFLSFFFFVWLAPQNNFATSSLWTPVLKSSSCVQPSVHAPCTHHAPLSRSTSCTFNDTIRTTRLRIRRWTGMWEML